MYIVIAILIFVFLILIHELGHFIAAKSCGVPVSEFAIGMGPAIWKRKRGETQYSIRCLPVGGYCAMGEDDESDDPRAFPNQKWWKKLIILVSGAAMNFLFGVLILFIIVPGSPAYTKPVLTDFYEGCPYESADGLQAGDEFYTIDGQRVYFSSDISLLLSRRGSETCDIVVVRDGEKVELDDFYFMPVEYEVDGVTETKYGIYYGEQEEGFFVAIRNVWYASMDFIRMVWMGLSDLVSGAVGLDQLSGPVGIVGLINDVGAQAATTAAAASTIAYLTAFIAINLAVMNLLPLPALDGGRVFLLLVTSVIEKIRKKKVNPKYEGYIHATGLVLLLGLTAVVMYNDIARLIG